MKRLAGLFAMGLVACSQPTEVVEPSPRDNSFVQAFMSVCVRDLDNRERVLAAAESMDWQPIEDPDIRKMLSPDDENADWQGWLVELESYKFMMAMTDAEIDDVAVKNCVLISELDSVQGTKDEIVKILSAELEEELDEAGQTTEVWRFSFEETPRLLTFIDGDQMGMDLLNASVSTDWTSAQ